LTLIGNFSIFIYTIIEESRMTEENKVIANNIFNSISIVLTEEIKKTHNLDTLDKQIAFSRTEKEKQTKEQLVKRGIIV